MKININEPWKLVTSIIICQLAGIIGSIFTSQSIPKWYNTLSKAAFNPPSWVFAPAWITLYTLMGISLYLIWTKSKNFKTNKKAGTIFGIQLMLNALWSIIFFGLREPFLALIEIAFLWIAIVFTIKEFYPISKKAAYLLTPYLLWVSFAATLNYFIVILN